MLSQKKYKYKVTVLNVGKRSKKSITRYLHQFSARFSSITEMKVHILEEMGDDLPGNINFELGYYEKRSTKCLVTSSEDLDRMYDIFKFSPEIPLWCDADQGGGSDKSRKRKRDAELDEDNVEKIYQELKKKHSNLYTVPQYRLWARMLHCDTHDNYDVPPSIPMFSESQPKKKKELPIGDGVVVISRSAMSPLSVQTPDVRTVGVSPGRSVDLRMKNLEQLRCIQNLFDDSILSLEEFKEQKQAILDSIRKLDS